MAKQMGDITLKGEEEALYTSESQSNNKPSTKHGYKNGDKRKGHQGNTYLREFRKMTIRVLKESDLKIIATVARRSATCP